VAEKRERPRAPECQRGASDQRRRPESRRRLCAQPAKPDSSIATMSVQSTDAASSGGQPTRHWRTGATRPPVRQRADRGAQGRRARADRSRLRRFVADRATGGIEQVERVDGRAAVDLPATAVAARRGQRAHFLRGVEDARDLAPIEHHEAGERDSTMHVAPTSALRHVYTVGAAAQSAKRAKKPSSAAMNTMPLRRSRGSISGRGAGTGVRCDVGRTIARSDALAPALFLVAFLRVI
jgi:hypothetical protein